MIKYNQMSNIERLLVKYPHKQKMINVRARKDNQVARNNWPEL